MPGAVVGDAYNLTISATGGNGAYSYSVSGGSLPAGLSLQRCDRSDHRHTDQRLDQQLHRYGCR